MNEKGQAEVIGVFIGAIVGLVIVGALFWGLLAPEFDVPSNNFCQAWANEKNVTHLDAEFRNPILENSYVACEYTLDAETFDGGISEGDVKFKRFEISIQDLEEWRYKK